MYQYTKWMLSLMDVKEADVEGLLALQTVPLDDVFFKAKDLLETALSDDKKIFVGGDYDADGICATTILVRMFKKLGQDVGYYIPDRLKEGYGISQAIIEAAMEKGYDVFIFVDNGVSLHEQLAYLKEHKKQVIILDHHTLETEPVCDVLIHPDLLSDYYHQLCGAGLSYCLNQALGFHDSESLQLAMVATIGDMVPLVNFNRDLVKKGLRSINEQPMLHLSNLIKKQSIDEEDVAFNLVPKLNAIGRLSDIANVNTLVNFFLNDDVSAILSYVTAIESVNQKRKALVRSMQKTAMTLVNEDPFNFIVDANFHQGVVGILAGHVMRLTNKPTLVATISDDIIKGSLRAENVDLFQVIHHARDHVKQFGGHQKAAGIQVHVDDFDEFKSVVLEHMEDFKLEPGVKLTPVVQPQLISLAAIKEFESFGPFGMGFERPVVALENMDVVRTYHNDRYQLSKWIIKVNDLEIEAVSFDALDPRLKTMSPLTFEGTIQYKPYNGYDKVVMRLEKVHAKNINKNEILI